ncbi:MAG: S-layer homology domain-containing protein [Clostridia bacterium]|nr:S-layer homology domain-containing protein [Clostridia bacterium]
MKKKFLIIMLLLLINQVSGEVLFYDVSESAWYYDIVTELGSNGVISGIGNQMFGPEQTITVEAFVTLALKAKGIEPLETQSDYWADGYLEKAKTLNWIQANEFSKYDLPINRGEMCRIVLRAIDMEPPDDYLKYNVMIKDFEDMSSYWQNIVLRAYALGIMSGYPDQTFRIDGYATRAEASAIIIKLYDPTRLNSPKTTVSPYDLQVATIKKSWLYYQPVYDGPIFSKMPIIESPYDAGALTTGYLDDGIHMLSFLRSIVGLLPVAYSSEANDLAQHGALLNAVSEFSHTPNQPEDMSDFIYEKGYNATSSGNLAAGITPLSTAIVRLVEDEDIYNIDKIGHRRWFLLPQLKEVGLGYVEYPDNYQYYSVIKVFNGLQQYDTTYDIVPWPSSIAFPMEFFDETIPWSISLNPDHYNSDQTDGITVTLSDREHNKIYTFDSSDKDKEGEYFKVETSGYGIPFCIIFRPNPSEITYEINNRYTIEINNLYLNTGEKINLNYETTFFNLMN